MSFKRIATSAVLFVAAALPSVSAWALTPAQVNGLSAANIVYVSGSTSIDAALQAWAKLDPTLENDTAGPSAPAWPAAIRAIGVAGQGPNSPISKTYPEGTENNCNGAFQSNPTG